MTERINEDESFRKIENARLTKLTAETSNVIFVVNGASPVRAEDAQVVLDELGELVAHWNLFDGLVGQLKGTPT